MKKLQVTFKADTKIVGVNKYNGELDTNFFKCNEALLNVTVINSTAGYTVYESDAIHYVVNNSNVEVTEMPEHVYKIGDKYRSDFDYTGMLRAGVSISCNDSYQSIDMLRASLADVNYHTLAKAANAVLIEMENGQDENAWERMTDFNILCAKEILGEIIL